MKKPLLLFLAAASLLAADFAAEGALWWSHIQFLADDKLEGRNTGSEGFRKAVEYVSSRFESFGLKPAGTSGYLQPIKFETRLVVADESSLALVTEGNVEPLTLGRDATLNSRVNLAPAAEAPMVFVGHGFVIPEAHYNDLAGLNLHGKIAVVLGGGTVLGIPGNLMSHYSSTAERWKALRKAGAIGVANLRAPAARAGAARGGNPTAAPAGDAAAAQPPAGRGPPQLSMILADKDLQDTQGESVALTITTAGAAKFFAGTGHTLSELVALDKAKEALPKFPLASSLRIRAVVKRDEVEAPNVAAVLPGSDPKLKNEYVIMSAHLDHLGVGRPVNGDAIYNGAMDDASGIASLLEIARLFEESGVKPKRSVIFLAVAAEEKGELGSKYFAAHPTVPFRSIVADINLDMFLPIYALKVIEVQGLAESTLGDTVTTAAASAGVKVQADQEPEENRFIRSDQYSFILRGVPSLAFKFGYEPGSPEEAARKAWVKDVYHKPSDDLNQKVDTAAAAQFDRIIMSLLQRVADDPARPKWKDDSFFKRFAK